MYIIRGTNSIILCDLTILILPLVIAKHIDDSAESALRILGITYFKENLMSLGKLFLDSSNKFFVGQLRMVP